MIESRLLLNSTAIDNTVANEGGFAAVSVPNRELVLLAKAVSSYNKKVRTACMQKHCNSTRGQVVLQTTAAAAAAAAAAADRTHRSSIMILQLCVCKRTNARFTH
jgi:hypothetical protein